MSYRVPTYTSVPLGALTTPDISWSPSATRAYMEQIHTAVAALGRDVASSEAQIRATGNGAAFMTGWHGFKTRWGLFYGQNRDAWFPSSDSTAAFAAEYNGYENQYRAITGRAPSAPTPLDLRAPGPDNTMMHVGIVAAVGLVGLIGTGYLAAQVARIYSTRALLTRGVRTNRRRRR